METTEKKGKGHGHPWIVGIAGIIIAAALYIHLPQLKVLSGTVLLFAMVHLIIAVILIISAYMITPPKLIYNLFEKKAPDKIKGKYDFGWSYGWMNLLWLAAIVFLVAAVWVYLLNSHLIWLSIILFLFSLNIWAGNFILRASKSDDYMTLPYTDLFPNGSESILDAGCGAGRTTVALGRAMKMVSVTALDRFDSDYIENGGMTLLERNLKIAGISDRVKICRGDVTKLDFPSDSFDAAISSYMVDHLGKYKIVALREINRVIKPGSRFLLIVFIPNYTTFSIMNVLSLALTSRKGWRELFEQSNFIIKEEGLINSGAWFLIEKPNK
jgi:SAM-dependent methyltransferase